MIYSKLLSLGKALIFYAKQFLRHLDSSPPLVLKLKKHQNSTRDHKWSLKLRRGNNEQNKNKPKK